MRGDYFLGYMKEVLPVLDYVNTPPKLYMEEDHPVDSGGLNSRVLRSRKTKRLTQKFVLVGLKE